MQGMDTLDKPRRSAWVQGSWRIALLVVGLVAIYVGSEKSRPYVIGTVWFLLISVVIGVVMAFVIRWWNERRPVKSEDEEGIRLHLTDDDTGKK
jgi:CHASE2 domain-containing sensor protein